MVINLGLLGISNENNMIKAVDVLTPFIDNTIDVIDMIYVICSYGYLKVIQQIWSTYCIKHLTYTEYTKMMSICCVHGYLDCVKWICDITYGDNISKQCDVNKLYFDIRESLRCAHFYGHTDIVDLIYKKFPESLYKEGNSVRYYSQMHGFSLNMCIQ